MRFGPLKPVGLIDPRTGEVPYAVLQLRREQSSGEMYNLVGCQTRLTFSAQREVFGPDTRVTRGGIPTFRRHAQKSLYSWSQSTRGG